MMQTIVHFFCFPAQVLCVLRHLQTRRSYTACIHSLTRCKEHTVRLEEMDSARLATHVGYLAAAPATVLLQFLRILFAQLVLESARKGDVTRNRPCLLAFCEFAILRELISHILHFIAVRSTHNEHIINHFRSDTIRNSHYAVRTGDSDNFRAKLDSFLSGTPSHVSEARDSNCLALDIFACLMQQVLREIECTVAGSLRTEN